MCNRLPSTPGTKHTQFVSIAPLTTSKSGSTAMNIKAKPTTWNVSMTKTTRKWDAGGFFHDLKIHILMLRINVPNSGTAKAIMMHQIHAILSCSGNVTSKYLSRPMNQKNILEYYWNSYWLNCDYIMRK